MPRRPPWRDEGRSCIENGCRPGALGEDAAWRLNVNLPFDERQALEADAECLVGKLGIARVAKEAKHVAVVPVEVTLEARHSFPVAVLGGCVGEASVGEASGNLLDRGRG